MAKVRKNVARLMRNDNSLVKIIRDAKANADYTKWDVVKTFLWWCWYKLCDGALWLWPYVLDVMNVLLWLFLLIVGGGVMIVVTVATVISSPLWMTFRLWLAPEKTAKYLLSNAYSQVKEPGDVPFVFMRNVWNTGAKLLKYLWWPVWTTLPMSKRQYFIDRREKPLAYYSPKVQIDYFREKGGDAGVINEMSGPAVQNLWQLREVNERCYILRALPLSKEWNEGLFSDTDQMFDILKLYCETATRPLSSEMVSFYITQMVGGMGESPSRAFELLKICCKKRALENAVLLEFVELLGRDAGEKANELLNLYFEKNTFSNEVVEALVVSATEPVIDEARERAYQLLLKVVRRDGMSTELAEKFFDRCDEAQDEEMSKILEMRCDLDAVSFDYDNADNREGWTKYCSLTEELSDEAQVKMVEWQYDIFHESGHKLSESVIYELLVKRISREEMSYFEKVLDEEGRNTLSETAMKLIMMTPWKRDIIIKRAWVKKQAEMKGTI